MHLYDIGKVWCTHCGEPRDANNTVCPDCRRMLRRGTRQKAYKKEVKRIE